jgi:hypothetical protein
MESPKPILLALMLAAVPAWAQNSTSPGAQAAANSAQPAQASGADTSSLILTRNPDESTPTPDAGLEPVVPLSANLAGELATDRPRYKPEEHAKAEAAVRAGDLAAGPAPRLPDSVMSKYTVRGNRLSTATDRDFYTDQGLLDASVAEHPGLRFGNLLNLNDGAAFEAYLAEERLVKMQDLNGTAVVMEIGGDAAEAKAIREAAAQAFMRTESQEGPVGAK